MSPMYNMISGLHQSDFSGDGLSLWEEPPRLPPSTDSLKLGCSAAVQAFPPRPLPQWHSSASSPLATLSAWRSVGPPHKPPPLYEACPAKWVQKWCMLSPVERWTTLKRWSGQYQQQICPRWPEWVRQRERGGLKAGVTHCSTEWMWHDITISVTGLRTHAAGRGGWLTCSNNRNHNRSLFALKRRTMLGPGSGGRLKLRCSDHVTYIH